MRFVHCDLISLFCKTLFELINRREFIDAVPHRWQISARHKRLPSPFNIPKSGYLRMSLALVARIKAEAELIFPRRRIKIEMISTVVVQSASLSCTLLDLRKRDSNGQTRAVYTHACESSTCLAPLLRCPRAVSAHMSILSRCVLERSPSEERNVSAHTSKRLAQSLMRICLLVACESSSDWQQELGVRTGPD